MSKKTIIVRSAVPDIRRRQDEADYYNPLLGMTNGEYWTREKKNVAIISNIGLKSVLRKTTAPTNPIVKLLNPERL